MINSFQDYIHICRSSPFKFIFQVQVQVFYLPNRSTWYNLQSVCSSFLEGGQTFWFYIISFWETFMLQTSEKLVDLYRTEGPVTTWKIIVLLVFQNFHRTWYNFFNIIVPIEGLTTGIFLPNRRTGTIIIFIGPPLFSPGEDRGLVNFPMSDFRSYRHSEIILIAD